MVPARYRTDMRADIVLRGCGPKGDIRSGHKFAVPRMTSRKCRCLAVGPRHSDSGAEFQVINFEQNWHRLSLYLSGGVGVESATVEAANE